MRRVLFTSGVALFTALAFAFPTPMLGAQAQPPSSGASCVYQLEHLPGSTREARVASITCFDSLADALSYATAPQTIAAGTLSSVVLGIDWDYPNYSGDNRVWTASSGCTPSQSWALSYVGAGWNDRTASAIGYTNCHHYHHYEHINYGGSQIDCHSSCATMGVMTDATSSESWDY
jgi:hypothetical protein